MGTTLNFISSVQFRSMEIPFLVDEKTKRMSPIELLYYLVGSLKLSQIGKRHQTR